MSGKTKVVIAGVREPKKPKPIAADASLKEKIIFALRHVFDPELPVNVYDLGLIYGIDIAGDDVTIEMTLTAPNCPVAGDIVADVEKHVAAVDGVKKSRVNLCWEPKWTQDRMSKAAKLELGLL